MTGVVIGKIIDVKDGLLLIEDHVTKETITCESDSDEVLDLKLGESAIFVGPMYDNRIRVKRYEIRRFLDPLYEEELYDASGKFTLIPPINNPFTDSFIEFMERRKAQEEAEAARLADEMMASIHEAQMDALGEMLEEFANDI